MFFVFALFIDEPEVFLPEHSQTAKRHAAHFWRVVNVQTLLSDSSMDQNSSGLIGRWPPSYILSSRVAVLDKNNGVALVAGPGIIARLSTGTCRVDCGAGAGRPSALRVLVVFVFITGAQSALSVIRTHLLSLSSARGINL